MQPNALWPHRRTLKMQAGCLPHVFAQFLPSFGFRKNRVTRCSCYEAALFRLAYLKNDFHFLLFLLLLHHRPQRGSVVRQQRLFIHLFVADHVGRIALGQKFRLSQLAEHKPGRIFGDEFAAGRIADWDALIGKTFKDNIVDRMLRVESRDHAVGHRSGDHPQVSNDNIANVPATAYQGCLLVRKVAEDCVPGATAVHAVSDLRVGGRPVSSIGRIDDREINEPAASILHADVLVGYVLNCARVAVVDTHGRAVLHVDQVDIFKAHIVNGVSPVFKADLQSVPAVRHVPYNRVRNTDVRGVNIRQILHHHAVVVGADKEILDDDMAGGVNVNAVVTESRVRIQNTYAVDPRSISLAQMDGPGAAIEDGDALDARAQGSLQVNWAIAAIRRVVVCDSRGVENTGAQNGDVVSIASMNHAPDPGARSQIYGFA